MCMTYLSGAVSVPVHMNRTLTPLFRPVQQEARVPFTYLSVSLDGDARGFPACCCWCSSALVLCHERRIAWSNLSHRASVPFSLSLPYHHAVLPASCERGRNWTHEKVAFKLSWLMIDPRIIAPAIRFSHQIRERNEACFFFIHRSSITAAS
jgi:hypothetical protein